jgi:hypothetical protein
VALIQAQCEAQAAQQFQTVRGMHDLMAIDFISFVVQSEFANDVPHQITNGFGRL